MTVWLIIKRLTGTFFQHKQYPDASVHATDPDTFFLLEPNGVTKLDGTDLYAALDEADALLHDARTVES